MNDFPRHEHQQNQSMAKSGIKYWRIAQRDLLFQEIGPSNRNTIKESRADVLSTGLELESYWSCLELSEGASIFDTVLDEISKKALLN